jgi:hypothetical protein
MLFHFLLGALTLGWQKWPSDLSEGHGPDTPPPEWLAALQGPTCLDRHESQCMEDAVFDNEARKLRLTCLWTDYGDVSTLGALETLRHDATGAVPDALIVGFGAWWVWHRGSLSLQYEDAVRKLLNHLDQLFPTASTAKVFASTTSCGRKDSERPDGDGTARVAARFNSLAKKHVLQTKDWSWFDRDVITGLVCDVDADCAGNQYTSRFHPAGDALNVLVSLLLGHLVSCSPAGHL